MGWPLRAEVSVRYARYAARKATMSSEGASAITDDRQLLLLGSKRNVMLDLSEVLRYGIDSYGDADYVSIYGLAPVEWYGKGIRLLGRTAVECTRDQIANAIGQEIAAIATTSGSGTPRVMIVDPFVGSGHRAARRPQH